MNVSSKPSHRWLAVLVSLLLALTPVLAYADAGEDAIGDVETEASESLDGTTSEATPAVESEDTVGQQPELSVAEPEVEALELIDSEEGLSTLSATDSLTPLAPTDFSSVYIYVSASQNLVLDIFGNSTAAGADAISWPANYKANQRFNITQVAASPDPSDPYYIISPSHSNLVLDIYGGGATDDARVIQWPLKNDGSLNQYWQLREAPGGGVVIVSALNPDLVLDAVSTSSSQNTKVRTYDPAASSQVLTIVDPAVTQVLTYPSSAPSWLTLETAYAMAATSDTSKVLDIPGNSTSNGAQPALWEPKTSDALNQEFWFAQDPDTGFYTVQALNSGLYLDVYARQLFAGTAIIQWSRTGVNQLFDIVEVAPNQVQIISVSNGLALAIEADKLVLAKPDASQPNQVFELEARDDSTDALADGALVNWKLASNGNQLIDISGAAGAGAEALLWSSHGNANQKFQVEALGSNQYTLLSAHAGTWLASDGASATTTLNPLDYSPTAPAEAIWTPLRAPGGYKLQNAAGGYLLATGSALSLTTDPSQATLFKYQSTEFFGGDGYYQLRFGNLYLDVTGASKSNGAALTLWTAVKRSNQKFKLEWRGGGYFSLMGAASDKVLDINGNNPAPAAVIQWGYNGQDNQLWQVVVEPGVGAVLQSKTGAWLAKPAAAGKGLQTTDDPAEALVLTSVNKTSYTRYFGTYVDVNLSTQHFMFIKDGELIVESDVITGNPNRGWGTPTGHWRVLYKTRDTHLVAFDYDTFVQYWMPFTTMGHGLHDCYWKDGFGGTTYLWNGSHGCVNIPTEYARELYENIDVGTEVWVHW
ncbi:MAG: RICIN domain-containing protein [Coriobacteriales bacterium]|jgi:lipoprotein-anchoring transpeptidase ErfK/SrfK|nr:RICIN domain-containing protein [Coriobacteriales bacterium]